MKRLLCISVNGIRNKVFIATKSDLYKELKFCLEFFENDFLIDRQDDKVNFFETVVVLITQLLAKREEPELPKNLYVSVEEMYRRITFQNAEYNMLQGHQVDGDILTLIELKNLVSESITKSSNILGKFISRKAEAL